MGMWRLALAPHTDTPAAPHRQLSSIDYLHGSAGKVAREAFCSKDERRPCDRGSLSLNERMEWLRAPEQPNSEISVELPQSAKIASVPTRCRWQIPAPIPRKLNALKAEFSRQYERGF
jgi:hypothetical protein